MNTAIDTRTGKDKPLFDEFLGQVDIRVDIVRMDVYRLFINAKSYDDFYFEEVLNRFVSAAQASLNFAIYDQKGNLLFHLVNDPKYHETITKELKKEKYFNKSFQLFPNLLGEDYYILVLHMKSKMETKKAWFEVITFNNELPSWCDPGQDIDVKYTPIQNQKTYLKRCAWRFFNCPWDGFETQLFDYARKAVKNSIDELAENFRPCSGNRIKASWPPLLNEVSDSLDDIPLPNTKERAAGWHDKLRQIFYRDFRDSASGLKAQHFLMHSKADTSGVMEDGTPNMLVAYRTFCRPHKSIRGAMGKDKGYLYDTQFLIPDALEVGGNFIWDMFENLQVFSEFFEANTRNTYEDKGSRLLYRNIFSEQIEVTQFDSGFASLSEDKKNERHGIYRHITSRLDEMFWKLIASQGGVRKCIEMFRSPVGDNARSLADSVYHTGLIHTNFVFEHAGLDRILGVGDISTLGEANDYIEENKDDLLRVVMLFYAMSEMVNWNGTIKNFDPKRIAAVLMPVKMRGAVWAVTIHATYVHKSATNFQILPYWLSYYHLTTTLGLKNSRNFDQILWGNIQARVSRVLEKCIVENPKPEQFRKACDEFNLKMLGEQRLVPYALPQIRVGAHPNEADDYIKCKGIDDEEYALCWDIANNPFYEGAQKWNRKGTRSFASSIRNGLDRGFENQIWG